MWKPEHRPAADRRGLRCPSDLTDAEWAFVSLLIPPARRGGCKRTVDVREILNAIFYVLYLAHVTTRKSLGEMTRKLSVIIARSAHLRGTFSRKKPSVASANWAHVA